jgi:hypothetical protein
MTGRERNDSRGLSLDARMRHSLFPSDASLPTWLHTLLLLLVVSPLSGFLLWRGVHAVTTAQMEPLRGPDLGEFFFGPVALHGKAARVAGVSLILLGCALVALALNYSRLARVNKVLRSLPWVLVAISVGMLFWVASLA